MESNWDHAFRLKMETARIELNMHILHKNIWSEDNENNIDFQKLIPQGGHKGSECRVLGQPCICDWGDRVHVTGATVYM